MTFLELVKKRKSTRRYLAKPVPRELIDQCLEAARLAPSACNSQPWSFIVVDHPDKKNDIVSKAMSGIYSSNSFVKQAPVIIVVLTEKSKYIARLGGQLRGVKYNLIDIGVACDHFVLQAEELGLGTCWLGWFKEQGVKNALGLSNKVHIDLMICLGFPDDNHQKGTKIRKSLSEIRKYYE